MMTAALCLPPTSSWHTSNSSDNRKPTETRGPATTDNHNPSTTANRGPATENCDTAATEIQQTTVTLPVLSLAHCQRWHVDVAVLRLGVSCLVSSCWASVAFSMSPHGHVTIHGHRIHACCPGHPELSKSYMDMASKLVRFTLTFYVQAHQLRHMLALINLQQQSTPPPLPI